jgi:hypothetical protein
VQALTVAMHRRDVLFGGLLMVLWKEDHATACCSEKAAGTGCRLLSGEESDFFARTRIVEAFETGDERIEERSGNPQLDRALAQSLAMIARMFSVLPGFGYYDDSDGPNARATPAARLGRTDGTVMFGLKLLKQLLAGPERPDASIVAVCAHEFGHIVSYNRSGMIDKLSPDPRQPFRAEQYADYIAGFFAGKRKLEEPNFPAVVFATTQRRFGGGDHGTGQQRGEAVQQGFLAAFDRKLTPEEGVQAAFNFAMAQHLAF